MEKANMHSLDMVNENIKKIGNLFPECVTETVDENGNVKAAIDFEKLQENLSHATIGEGEERYQFTLTNPYLFFKKIAKNFIIVVCFQRLLHSPQLQKKCCSYPHLLLERSLLTVGEFSNRLCHL